MALDAPHGSLRVRTARTEEDLRAAFRLRHRAFVERAGLKARPGSLETDAFDMQCRHVLIEGPGPGRGPTDRQGQGPGPGPGQGQGPEDNQLLATFRALPMASAAELPFCYSARRYDLGPLAAWQGPILELGRFCLAPGAGTEVLRMALGAVGQVALRHSATLVIGCPSLPGGDPALHADALARLSAHVGPEAHRPRRLLSSAVPLQGPPRPALLPALLAMYLSLGGWTSDHAVPDPELDTTHVFTGLDLTAIPFERRRRFEKMAWRVPLDMDEDDA